MSLSWTEICNVCRQLPGFKSQKHRGYRLCLKSVSGQGKKVKKKSAICHILLVKVCPMNVISLTFSTVPPTPPALTWGPEFKQHRQQTLHEQHQPEHSLYVQSMPSSGPGLCVCVFVHTEGLLQCFMLQGK